MFRRWNELFAKFTTWLDPRWDPVPPAWPMWATVYAGAVGLATVVTAICEVLYLDASSLWWGVLALFGWAGLGSCWGWHAGRARARKLVAIAASRGISYPSARFGAFYARLMHATPSSPSAPPISASTLVALGLGLLSGGGLVLRTGITPLPHLNNVAAEASGLGTGLVSAGIVFGVLYASFAAAAHDYDAAFRRASLQLYAAQAAASEKGDSDTRRDGRWSLDPY